MQTWYMELLMYKTRQTVFATLKNPVSNTLMTIATTDHVLLLLS